MIIYINNILQKHMYLAYHSWHFGIGEEVIWMSSPPLVYFLQTVLFRSYSWVTHIKHSGITFFHMEAST
jgi:hypothetical protein